MKKRLFLLASVVAPLVAYAQTNGNPHFNSITTTAPISSLYGGSDYSPAELPNWRAAVQNVQQGNSNATLLVIGDSTTLGANQTGIFFPKNFTYYLAQDLTNAGVTANNNGWCGISTSAGSTGSRINSGVSGDSRLALGSWVGNTTFGLGDYLPTATSTTASAFVYTPGTSVNTFQALILNVNGSVTLTPTGGTPVTDNTNSYSIATMTAGSLSSGNTLSAVWVTGASVIGCEGAYNSAIKQVNIYNAGWWGGYAGYFVYSDELSEIQTLAPNLTIIRCCINDIQSGNAASSVVGYINTVVGIAKLSGDVLIDDEDPISNDSGPTSPEAAAVNTALLNYAIANNIPFVDTFNRWTSFTVSNPLGYYSDQIHPSQLGYGDLARADAKLLTAP